MRLVRGLIEPAVAELGGPAAVRLSGQSDVWARMQAMALSEARNIAAAVLVVAVEARLASVDNPGHT